MRIDQLMKSKRKMRVDWKKRKVIYFIGLTFFIYVCCIRIKVYEYKMEITLPDAKAADVWEYMADFSNMKRLNPTMLDFKVLSESGNYNHWKYSVEYTEQLSHWPHLFNTAVASFDVLPDLQNGSFYVHSLHTTCLFGGYFCLDTVCRYTFSEYPPNGAKFEENINYECPIFLSNFCRREVEFQRKTIARNLKEEF